jgi:hypothetical protein
MKVIIMEQDFHKDLDELIEMLKKNEKYAFARFGDGECCILTNSKWLNRPRSSATWKHVPHRYEDEKFRLQLMKSIRYSDKNYFIGIHRNKNHPSRRWDSFEDKTTNMTTVPYRQLSFSCVFQHFNWKKSIDEFMPTALSKKCFLIHNEYGILNNKFNFEDTFLVPKENAHLKWNKTFIEIKNYIKDNNIIDSVFLFATGPGSSPIIHNLWKENKDNFFIDIGSILDKEMFAHDRNKGITRVYLKNKKDYRKIIW